jgi:primosomal protein N' (replication factor Y)
LCGHHEAAPDCCSKCGGIDLDPIGAGVESLESDLSKLLMDVKLLRLDRDQITSVKRLNQLLNAFRTQKANVLLGTQMLVKGHDFPGVTLVVVILADSLFRWPDFRSPERAYQVLKQVSGRSGRGDQAGRVLVQTFDPDHAVLQALDGRLSEDLFLEGERELRKALRYPPFGRIARLRFESSDKNDAFLRASFVAKELQLKQLSDVELLGPSEAFLEKAKGIYRWDLLIKAKNISSLQQGVFIAKQVGQSNKWQLSVDVDPYSI